MESEKEKQHFVPRFYLKKFSNNSDGKSIGVFLKDRAKFIKCASIEGQSQKTYYYGEDGIIENILMEIERPAAKLFNKIVESSTIPKTPVEDYFRILHFTVHMSMRNPAHSKMLLKSDEGLNDHFEKYKSSPEIESLLDSKLTTIQSIAFSLCQGPRISRMCLDLSCKLIVNKTSCPFISSDNPVVKYNIIADRYKSISASFASYGLQIFLPMSPTQILFFYDPKAYTIKEDIKDVIFITEDSELFQLNLLQVLNSSNCLYFNDTISETEILSLMSHSKKYNRPNEIIPLNLGSYFFQAISELKINLKLNSIQPFLKEHFPLNGQLVFPMRPHAKKVKEYFDKELINEE